MKGYGVQSKECEREKKSRRRKKKKRKKKKKERKIDEERKIREKDREKCRRFLKYITMLIISIESFVNLDLVFFRSYSQMFGGQPRKLVSIQEMRHFDRRRAPNENDRRKSFDGYEWKFNASRPPVSAVKQTPRRKSAFESSDDIDFPWIRFGRICARRVS